MRKILLALSALMALAVLVIGARTVIMRIEMKDGTVRYIDSEALSEFNFIKLDEIPASHDTRYITESCLKEALCYHSGYFTGRSHNVDIDITYVPNDPKDYIFTIKDWAAGCKPLQFFCNDNVVSVPCQSTGFIDPEYGEIWIADRENYATEVLGRDYTGFDYPTITYEGNVPLNIDSLILKVVYYAPGYRDGKSLAIDAEEKIYAKNVKRFSFSVDDYRSETDSKPFMEFKIRNTSGLPTKVGMSYGYIDIENVETFYDDQENIAKVNELHRLVNERCDNKEYDFVTDFSKGDIDSFKIPYSGSAYVIVIFSTIDNGGEPEVILPELCQAYTGFVYPGKNANTTLSLDGRYIFDIIYSGQCVASLHGNNPTDSTKNIKYELSLNDGEVIFPITVPDMDARTDDGYIPVSIDSTYIDNHSTYGRIMAADLKWYYTEYLPTVGFYPSDADIASIPPSVMDPESGSMRLNLMYYVPGYNDGKSFFGHGFEYFLVENTYTSLSACFSAKFDETDEPNKGAISISMSSLYRVADIGAYKVVTVTENVAETIAAIKAEPTAYTSYRATGAETVVPIDYEYDTDYQAIVVAYSTDGKYRGEQIISFRVAKPISQDDYDYLGKGKIADGWIVAAFTYNGQPIDPMDFMWSVDVYRSKIDTCEYLIAHPWADSPISVYNEFPEEATKVNIKIRIEGEYVFIKPQSSGFAAQDWGGPLIIGNNEGILWAANPDLTPEDIIRYIKGRGEGESISFIDEGCICIPKPFFGYEGVDGYRTWSNLRPTYIFLPDASNPSRARWIAPKTKTALPVGMTVSSEAIHAVESVANHNSIDSELNILPFEKIKLSK